jgi:hypothetical protein
LSNPSILILLEDLDLASLLLLKSKKKGGKGTGKWGATWQRLYLRMTALLPTNMRPTQPPTATDGEYLIDCVENRSRGV